MRTCSCTYFNDGLDRKKLGAAVAAVAVADAEAVAAVPAAALVSVAAVV